MDKRRGNSSAQPLAAMQDVSWLLARGTQLRWRASSLLQRSTRARARATDLVSRLREVTLTFGLVRLPSISGASKNDNDLPHQLRRLLSTGAAAIWIGPSRGAPCHACGKWISEGQPQYEAVADRQEMHFDAACFRSLIDDLRPTRPRPK